MTFDNNTTDLLHEWCKSKLGTVETDSDFTKSHPGKPMVTHRLRLGSDYCYLKTHRNTDYWESEVHGYEQWAVAFGSHAPQLLAVREDSPRALVVSSLSGNCLENVNLPSIQEQSVWRKAGRAIANLHDFAVGDFFGACNRDGSPRGAACSDAVTFMSMQLQSNRNRGIQMGYLRQDELDLIQTALGMTSVFEGELPVPCHRDYCPANWIVGDDGTWTGVIDFEFSEWNVRVTDFTRYPDWDWITRPEMVASFFEGYGKLSPRQEQQCLVAHALYALIAIVWGEDSKYHGFAKEGRDALKHLKELL